MFLFCISCKKDNYTATDFKSNFSKKETLAVSNLEYWSDNKHFSKNDNIIKKKGINIGMSTNGSLFIGTPSPNHKNSSVINALKNGVDLKISIANNKNSYTIDFAVLEIDSGKVLSRISKRNVAPEQIIGDLALISSFENVDLNNTNNNRSVWFKDWEIKGTKVTILNQ